MVTIIPTICEVRAPRLTDRHRLATGNPQPNVNDRIRT
jgi:hypothetical protein